MCRILFLLLISLAWFSACQNGPEDTLTPPSSKTLFDSLRLKSFVKALYVDGNLDELDSSVITVDAANRRIRIKTWYVVGYYDSSVATYTYDDQYRLIDYQNEISGYVLFEISRMQFTRDAAGNLLQCLSEYRDDYETIPPSTGTFEYWQTGDTSFIHFRDSTQKYVSSYAASDNDIIAFLNNRPVYKHYLPVESNPGTESEEFIYDASGNLSEWIHGDLTGAVYEDRKYTRLNHGATELQRFNTALFGDLYWFGRAKMLYAPYFLIGDYYLTGNAIASYQSDSYSPVQFQNVFDAEGNLVSVDFLQFPPDYGGLILREVDRFEYLPK